MRKLNSETQPLHEISMDASIYSSPVFANGVLYLPTRTTLFAIAADKDQPDPEQTGGYWPQWRGPNRDNVSPEKGLLKEWPEAGPPLVWRLKGLGEGISPVSIADGRIFALSNYETTEYIRALDERTGEPLWSAVLGTSVRQNPRMRWLTQRPVTLDGERLYAMSLLGELVCLQTADGKELWRINYPREFAGEHGVYGYSDCPIVAGDKLLCSPGGSRASIVALDSKTGTVVWTCAVPDAGRAAYGNGVVMTIDGQSHFVASLEKALVGVAIDSGKLLWHLDDAVIDFHHPHTPLVRDHFLTTANAFGTGLKLFEIYRVGSTFDVKEVFSMKATNHIALHQDDTVILADRVYEPSNGIFSCFNAQTGTVIWQNRMGPTAAVTCADGKFYFHSDGLMTLVEPTAEKPIVRSEFALPDPQQSSGTTTPVVTGGRLYVREDDQLFCFDVRESALAQKAEPPTIQLELPTPAAGSGETSGEPKTRTLRSVFVPTPQDIVDKMLELAAVKKTDAVYDLGSGDGRIVITAAQKFGCRAIGFELDKELVESSRTKADAAGVKSLVTFEPKDLFTADLQDADVIAVFLLPQQLEKLVPQLEKMKPRSRIISHQFEIPGFPADQVVKAESSEDGAQHTLYLWTLPLKKENK